MRTGEVEIKEHWKRNNNLVHTLVMTAQNKRA